MSDVPSALVSLSLRAQPAKQIDDATKTANFFIITFLFSLFMRGFDGAWGSPQRRHPALHAESFSAAAQLHNPVKLIAGACNGVTARGSGSHAPAA